MWRQGMEPQGCFPPNQPSVSLPGPWPQISRAHPQDPGQGPGHAPLGNQKQVPSQHPPFCPQGIEYAKGVLLGTPIQSLAVPMGVVGLV